MNYLLSISTILLLINYSTGVEQSCRFTHATWAVSYDGKPVDAVYACRIDNASLVNENDVVTTNTNRNNTKSNQNVLMLYYMFGNNLTFIPNQIFNIFPNMKYFYIQSNQGFSTIKPSFFANATNLKVFQIYGNPITELKENIFVEAQNLENIHLQENMITTIHSMTFSGLSKLQGLFLQNNLISILDPKTFSHLSSLKTLNLFQNDCVQKKFQDIQQNFTEIEKAISKFCEYEKEPEEEPIVVEENAETIANLTDKIDELSTILETERRVNLERLNSITEIMEKTAKANDLVMFLEKSEKQMAELEKTMQKKFEETLKEVTKKNFEDTEDLKRSIHDKELKTKAEVDEKMGKLEDKIEKLTDQLAQVSQKLIDSANFSATFPSGSTENTTAAVEFFSIQIEGVRLTQTLSDKKTKEKFAEFDKKDKDTAEKFTDLKITTKKLSESFRKAQEKALEDAKMIEKTLEANKISTTNELKMDVQRLEEKINKKVDSIQESGKKMDDRLHKMENESIGTTAFSDFFKYLMEEHHKKGKIDMRGSFNIIESYT